MKVFGIHKGRSYKLTIRREMKIKEVYRLRACVLYVWAILQEMELLFPTIVPGTSRGEEERNESLNVIAHWYQYILVPLLPFLKSTVEKLESGLMEPSPEKANKLLGYCKIVVSTIGEIGGKLRALRSWNLASNTGAETVDMLVISPWEALIRLVLGQDLFHDPGQILERLQQLEVISGVESEDLAATGQPQMCHIAVLDDSSDVPIAVIGFSRCRLEFHAGLKEWARNSRLDCMDGKEREVWTDRQNNVVQRFEAWRDWLNPAKERRSPPQTRLSDKDAQVESMVRVINDLQHKRNGSAASAIAITFPTMEPRNRCFICRATTNWTMHQEKIVEDAMRQGPKQNLGATLTCAEVESDIQVQRLVDQGLV